jgi:hypothetical protein
MVTTIAGLVAALILFGLLLDREIRRVAAPTVGRTARPRIGPVVVPIWAEVVLWAAAAVLLLPRIVSLLT